MDFSIVVPCYNESPNLKLLADSFSDALGSIQKVEVLLVNNGSTDDTALQLRRLLQDPRYHFIRTVSVEKNRGYGFGILSGLAQARGEFLAWTHADMQTDPHDVLIGWRKIQIAPNPETSILKGVRVGRPWIDALFTTGMGWLSSIALSSRVHDVNAQPKIFHRSFLETLGSAPFDFSLDLYVLYLANKLGYSTLEIPVTFGKRNAGEAKGGGSLKGKWKLTRRTLRYILQLRKDVQEMQSMYKVFDRDVFASHSTQGRHAA